MLTQLSAAVANMARVKVPGCSLHICMYPWLFTQFCISVFAPNNAESDLALPWYTAAKNCLVFICT